MPEFPSSIVNRKVPVHQWANLPADNYGVPGVQPDATTTLTLTANTPLLFPQFVPIPLGLTALGAIVTGGVSAKKIRLGLFHWDHVNRGCGDLIVETSALDAEAADQGLVSEAVAQEIKAGWYAWGLTSDGAITVRLLQGIDPYVGGLFTVSTTTYVHPTHYTTDDATAIASGFADDPAVTAVTSASAFKSNFGVVSRFNLHPAV